MSEVGEAELDRLVEAIRVASFEAPKATSHREWSRRIKSLFYECCAECGADEENCAGDCHESGDPTYQPLVILRPLDGYGVVE